MSSISFVKGRAVSLWQALPERITTPVDIVRRSPHWRSVGAIFIHVPKAAGAASAERFTGARSGTFMPWISGECCLPTSHVCISFRLFGTL